MKQIGMDYDAHEILINEKSAKNPYLSLPQLKLKELKSLIRNSSVDEIFITIDDYEVIDALYDIKRETSVNLLIWIQYFKGHNFLFKKYRDIDPNLSSGVMGKFSLKLKSIIPPIIVSFFLNKYIKLLSESFVVTQSIWSALLTERVYSISVKGVLQIPIDHQIYQNNNRQRINRALVFMGNSNETDLKSTYSTIRIIEEITGVSSFDYFGLKETGEIFSTKYSITMNYLGSLTREQLISEYGIHILFISPIYNGNFEMMPIESILTGTPVITFLQPFQEITGFSEMIANINNPEEIKIKVREWISLNKEKKTSVRNKIVELMDPKVVARKLTEYAGMAMRGKNE